LVNEDEIARHGCRRQRCEIQATTTLLT
jgi:hypothetical protein